MTTYTIERMLDHLDELKKLAEEHSKESCPYEDIPLKVNWDVFVKMNEYGVLKFYAAKKEGKLIGYALFNVSHNLEYSTSLQGSLSNIFIHPDHRGTGTRFILWCEKQLKELGVQVVYHHVKAKNDYGVLLKRLGYDIMNIEYAKRLDK